MSKGAASAALFVFVFAAYLPGNMTCSDSMWSIPTAVSLIDHADGNLDEYLPQLAARGFAHTQRLGDHFYSESPLGTSILAIPGVVVLRPVFTALFRAAPSLWRSLETMQAARGCAPLAGEPIITLHSWAEHLIASAITAAAAVLMFWIAAGELSIAGAAAVALIFAFATPAWSTASRSLWQHGPSMLLLSAALWIQLRGGRLFWVGALLAFAYVVRPTNLLPFVVAAAWVVVCRTRRVPEFLAGAAPVTALFVLANLATQGRWLPPYFTPGWHGGNPFLLEALAGDLVSPGRGLFVYSPILLFAIAGFALKAYQRRLTMLDAALAACLVGHWIVVANVSRIWWGGHSYGPRFFADLMPYFVYFLIPVAAWIEAAPRGRRLAVAAVMAIAAIGSVAIHAQGALDAATVAWNAYPVNIDIEPVRVWDWRHPQFLAGITFTPAPPPPIDFGAVGCSEPPGRPAAPEIAANHDSTVVLEWPPPAGHPAVYIVEIGDAPGKSNFPSHEVRELMRPALIVHRVPPGTYFVRVRARNACGDGPASPETVVTVR